MLSNQLLMGSAAVSSTGLNQHAATARANRVILSSEFNRLAEIVKQMRARQEWTTHQLHLVRSENQLLYRELALLRSQHEQQSQLIQTLFNFFSAIATESRPSSIRIGAVKRKLALPEPSDSNKKRNQVDTSKVIYSLEPSILTDPTRLATESPFQDLLFAHPPVHSSDVQPNSDTVGNSTDVLARYSLPRVRLLPQDVLSTGQVLPHSQSITAAPILSIREVPQSGSSPLTDVSPSGSPTTSRDKITCTGSATTEIGKSASPSKTNAVRRILPKSASARIFSTKSHPNAVLPQTRPISPSIVVNLADMMEAKSFDLDDLAYSTYFQDPGLDGGVPFDPQGFDYEPGDLLTPPQRSPQSPQQDENLDANTLFPDSFLLNDEVAQTENSLKGPPSGRLTRRKSAARRLPNSLVARDPDTSGVCPYPPRKKTTTERTSATSKSRVNGLPPSVDNNDLNSLSPLHAGELTSILANTGVITGASGDEASDIPTLQSSSSSMVASLPWEDVAAQETVVDGSSASLMGDNSNDNADVFKTRTANSLTEKIPPSSIPSPSYNIAHLNSNGVVDSPVTRAGGKVGGISGLNTPTILESFSQLPSPATPDAVVGGLRKPLDGRSPSHTLSSYLVCACVFNSSQLIG
ncbi:stress-responsive transcription factor hsf1 [Sparganum proliferum]